MSTPVPRSFRRESWLFLSVALLLILFLNFVTLLFFRNAVEWGSQQSERRAAQILRRLALAGGDPADSMDRAALEADVLFVGLYDQAGRRLRNSGHEFGAPLRLPTRRPDSGRMRLEWQKKPALLLGSMAAPNGVFLVALDPGAGTALRSYARSLTLLVPMAGAVLVVLAWFYLRSLLAPYVRLLKAAGSAPHALSAGEREPTDERDFVIARFEATTAALSQKERELERLARAEKERADNLEIAARTVARNLPTGLLSVDQEGMVLELNEAGREILGVRRDPRGEALQTLLAALPDFQELVASVLREQEAVGRREIRWGGDGDQRVIGVTVAPATGGDGRFLGVLALFSDLSEVRRLEARMALARHLADLGEVSAGAAHEFRNAAAAIDGLADLALRHPQRAAEHLRAIRREAQEMSRVTGDFLLFARPAAFLPELVGLDGVAEAACLETQAAFPGVLLGRAGEFPMIAGSPLLLRRALVNLLRNAVEATPRERVREPDAITLAGDASGEEVVLSVADRGPGVDPSSREKIFLPFYSTKPNGIGFGLAIVARIAELHGGTVEVTARPGGGALFTLRLPREGRPSPAGEPPSAAAHRQDRQSLL